MKPKKDLTGGSITKNMLLLSFPLVTAMFMQSMFTIVDTFFVAKLGTDAVAALSAVFPIFFIIIAITTGLSVGVSSYISRAIGAKKFEKVSEIAENGLLLSILISVAVLIAGAITLKPIISFLGVADAVGMLMDEYMMIIYIGSSAFFLGQAANAILMGEGDTKTPTKGFIIATILNIILDPILIFGFSSIPAMGVKGAAIATIIARSAGTIYVFAHLFSGKAIIKLAFKKLTLAYPSMKEILKVCIPTAATQMSVSIGFFFINKLVASFGSNALAGLGIASRIESIAILPVIALSISTITVIGQNMGAGRFDRAKHAFLVASSTGFIFIEIIGALLFFAGPFFISLFTKNPDVVSYGASYFKIIALFYGFFALMHIARSGFQATGKALPPLLLSAINFAVALLLAYILAFTYNHGTTGIWIGIATADVIAGTASLAWFYTALHRKTKQAA